MSERPVLAYPGRSRLQAGSIARLPEFTFARLEQEQEQNQEPRELTDEDLMLFTDDDPLDETRNDQQRFEAVQESESKQEVQNGSSDTEDDELNEQEGGDKEVLEALEDTLADSFADSREVQLAIKDVKREFPLYLGRDWVALIIRGLSKRYPANGFANQNSRERAGADFDSVWSVLPYWAVDPSFPNGKTDVRRYVAGGLIIGPNQSFNDEISRFLKDMGEIEY